MPSEKIALGLDFGTESVRALFVDLCGVERSQAAVKYAHGQITKQLPSTGAALPPLFALQHPSDWLNDAAKAVRQAMSNGNIKPESVIGIGVDFTSCTMLPAKADGTPLCLLQEFAEVPYAWPKLWKHHAAQSQTDRINEIARERNEDWLGRYGGAIGLEWFFPKILETLENAPHIYDATDVWVEAGDWFTWQLVGCDAHELPRSTCQAGYKAMWNSTSGYPSSDFFAAVHPQLAGVVSEKMPGRLLAPGQQAGLLCDKMAQALGLPAGIAVSAATIDAHAGVPGAGVSDAGTMVLVMGTSSCHMLNAQHEHAVPGVAGIVKDGIIPGYYGYETGQAAVGDAFDWLRRTLGHNDFIELTTNATTLPPGSEGVLCVDWFNGCRTPLMDGTLRGGFAGMSFHHGPAHMYRALLEASAFGLRWIIELLQSHDVPVDHLVATGGLPHHNPLLVQIYADVLNMPITVHPSKQGPALGAAILGAMAAGPDVTGTSDAATLIQAMAAPKEIQEALRVVEPKPAATKQYHDIYKKYRTLCNSLKEIA